MVYKTGQVHRKVSVLAQESQKNLQRLFVTMNRKVHGKPTRHMTEIENVKIFLLKLHINNSERSEKS